MEFVLTYRGPLKSNGRPEEKDRLRMQFHEQLSVLWDQQPLDGYAEYIGKEPRHSAGVVYGGDGEPFSIVEEIDGYFFAPLVSDKMHLVCSVDITMLREEPPGSLISGGDIDNRLKTLFDALSMPIDRNQIPQEKEKNSPGDPVLCVVRDDHLITAVAVRTDRFLECENRSDVLLLIRVTISAVRVELGNLGIGL